MCEDGDMDTYGNRGGEMRSKSVRKKPARDSSTPDTDSLIGMRNFSRADPVFPV